MIGWIIVLTLIGLALIAIDFYLPGFVLGSVGVLLMIGAVAVCFTKYGINWAAAVFIIEVVLGIGVGYASIKYLPMTGAGQKMILSHDQKDMHTGTSPAPELLGREGLAQTVLRPSGMALLDGKRLDVVAESGVIDRNSKIKVIAVDGTRIVVRKI